MSLFRSSRHLGVALTLSVLTAGMAFEARAGLRSSVSDVRITARIETLFLLNEELSPLNINTTTNKGVVTLTGSVVDDVQKGLAAELAEGVDGVRSVVNHLVVVDTPPEAPNRSWRQHVEDRTISASIRSRLLYHKQFKAMKIDVKCRDGNVTLSGVVDSEEHKDRIGRIAEETRGVASVTNNLTVYQKAKMDVVANLGRQVADEWVEKRVETAILMNRHVGIRDLGVEVDDGTCILTGVVRSAEQRELVGAIAASVCGVQSIHNNIAIDHAALSLEPIEVPEQEGSDLSGGADGVSR